jgi:cyanate permease
VGLFKIKSWVFTVLGQMSFGMMIATWAGWMPAFMMRAYQIDAAQAGGMVGSAALVGILGSLGAGFIADAWYKKNTSARVYLMFISR